MREQYDFITAGLTICAAFRTSKWGILCVHNRSMYIHLMVNMVGFNKVYNS